MRLFYFLGVLFFTLLTPLTPAVNAQPFPTCLLGDAAVAALFPTKDPVQMELLTENESIQPGRPFWALIKMEIDETWHAYWKNPGECGFPVSIEWNLPEGFTVGEVDWSYPKKIVSDSIVGFGYEKEAFFLVQITPSESVALAPQTLAANVRWLACSDTGCYPGESKLSLTLPMTRAAPEVNPQAAVSFAQARAMVPTKNWAVEGKKNGEKIELTVTTPESHAALAIGQFFAEEQGMIDVTAEEMFRKVDGSDNQYLMTLTPKDLSKVQRLKGVLVASNDQHTHAIAIDLIHQPESQAFIPSLGLIETPPPSAVEWEGGFGLALLFAFIGGIILNLMPCVLPVISFKVLSFVKMSGQSRSLSMKHGVAFFMGVLVSFWVLAGALLALQAYGRVVGWGFQLQEPLFVAILAAVLVIFSLSLFGVFEIGTMFASWAGQTASNSTTKSAKDNHMQLVGSFFSGVLATAVATPCTGPFLGSAIGFAVTLPPLLALLIFTSLGVGMALPYLLLAAFPSLLKFLPKPGPWMVTFKEIMGFVMLATVAWLIWVFGAETDYISTFMLLMGFLSLSFACWIWGKWGSPIRKRRTRLIGSTVATLFILLGSFTIFLSATKEPVESAQIASNGSWEPFSASRIRELRAQGTPVLVDFTAKWCLICQTNHLVLSLPEVSQKLDQLGVVKMKADWTKNDPEITKALKQFGRNGVPLYVIYGKDGAQAPTILPQVLTADTVLDHLKLL